MPVETKKRYEVDIERIVPRGYGITHAEGSTVFVALAAPGDRALVEIREIKGGVAFAEIVEVIEPSPNRVEARCKYFGECGGCNFQQMSYASQLDSKVNIVRDCLKRIGKIDWPAEIPIIASPKEFGYRDRSQWHLDPGAKRIGFYRRNSRDLVDIQECPILSPALDETLKNLRDDIEWKRFKGVKSFVDASVGGDGAVSVSSPDLPPSDIHFDLGDIRYYYNAGVFFQGNCSMIGPLVETAIAGATGGSALDLYSGVGLFTLPLAKAFGSVVGVEENAAAVDLAENNAEQNGVASVEFKATAVRRFLNEFDGPRPEFILLDPPRAGTEKETIQRVIELSPAHISYVSCEPSVLARDLKRFVEGGYKIDTVTALDMFPQTHHVETISRLSRG